MDLNGSIPAVIQGGFHLLKQLNGTSDILNPNAHLIIKFKNILLLKKYIYPTGHKQYGKFCQL